MALVFCVLCLNPMLLEPISSNAAQLADADAVAKAYFASRTSIWAGDLRVTCRESGSSGEEVTSYAVAFNLSEGCHFVEANATGHPVLRISDDGKHRCLFVEGQSIANVQRSGSPASSREQALFDWRAVGVVNIGEWNHNRTVESSAQFLTSPSVVLALERGDKANLVKLVWRGASETPGIKEWVREVTLDIDQNFSPVTMTDFVVEEVRDVEGGLDVSSRAGDVPEKNRDIGAGGTKVIVDSTSSFEWRELNGETVPTRWHCERSPGETIDYGFEWLSVNHVLDKDRFSKEALRMPAGVRVINKLTDQPFIEEVVGDNAAIVNPRIVLDSSIAGANTRTRWRVFTVIGSNVVLLALFVLITFVLRWRRKSK